MATPKKKRLARRRGLTPPRPAAALQPPLADGEEVPTARFPIVGIGASAGGLAAFEAFFSAMPVPNPGMAFILVQHLAPDHKSMLSDLVSRYTSMQVFEITDGIAVQPNCAYIIPPNHDLALLNGHLHLLEPSASRGLRLPIDFFFRSLAQDQHERAICIVLSGTGSDGTLGVRAVKGEGGMVMAQAPDSTEYDGMPRSAIATGLVDHVLPPAAMPAQLIAYTTHVFSTAIRGINPPTANIQSTLGKICVALRAQTGHDFSQYKTTTLIRRIERRMALHQIVQVADYLRYLQREPSEAGGLFHDLLIGVTSFFRDPEAFAAMQAQILPHLFADRSSNRPVRVWVCGCSTGEEAYSLAILFQEYLETLRQPAKVQIFATDVDERAITQARSGVFPASIAADISPERLARFFVQVSDGRYYRVQKTIRDMVIFSQQNVISDPPFSRLDLVTCRNLLIYLNSDLQRKLIPLFHYALSPGGWLLLGTSETIGEFVTLFTPLDRKWKLYKRQDDVPGSARPMLGAPTPALASHATQQLRAQDPGLRALQPNLRVLTEQNLLEHYAPAAVLVTNRGEILHVYGRTGNYLEPAPGDANLSIIAMAREGLRQELTIALHKAVAQKAAIAYRGLRVKTNGSFTNANLTVQPVARTSGETDLEDLFLVILDEVPPVAAPLPEPSAAEAGAVTVTVTDQRIISLEQELRAKDEYLQTAFEEMETANEELRSTNEELQSVNEELQSTNEELETSKEELQSVNEELATVNAELQSKLAALQQANNDLNNLLAGTGVGTLFVDVQLRIARFTPVTTQVINLIPTDVGRPVGHVVSNLVGYDRLTEDVQSVLDTLIPQEKEVQTKAGAWYLMHIRPYRTLDNVIEGVVITFIDTSKRIQAETRFQRAFQASPVAQCLIQIADGQLTDVNTAFLRLLGYQRADVIGRTLPELGLPLDSTDSTAADPAGVPVGNPITARDQAGNTHLLVASSIQFERNGQRYRLTFLCESGAGTRAAALPQQPPG